MPQHDVTDRLRAISGAYNDRLSAPARRAILKGALDSRSIPAPGHAFWSGVGAPRLAWAAAIALILASPLLFLREVPEVGRPAEVSNLTITPVGGDVLLTWRDGNRPRRVVRATSRQELAHLSEISGQVVTGESWMDTSRDGAQIVYYVVE